MKEYLLTTNVYLKPDVATGSDAYALLLLRLLLLQPGVNPLHPDMGVGLGPRYRFISENDIPMLRSRIKDQIHTYLPPEFSSVTTVKISLKENTKYLLITITAKDTEFVYDTEESSTPIELSDLVS